MSFKIRENLDEILETVFLIYVSKNPDLMDREQVIEQSVSYGVDGEKMFKIFEKPLKKYCTEFKNNMVDSSDYDIFFTDNDFDVFLIFLNILIGSKELMDEEELSKLDEKDLRARLLYEITNKDFDKGLDINSVIDILEEENLSDKVCWKITIVLKNPIEYMSRFIKLVKDNLPAYNKALNSVKKQIEKPLREFMKSDPEKLKISKIQGKENAELYIIPSLILPMGEILFDFEFLYYYVGIYMNDFLEEMDKKKDQEENIVAILKSLGDVSKFKIINSLKQGSKYNLELAEELGLTAATTSHHMGDRKSVV